MLLLLYEGYSQREIADRLGLARSTIRNHVEKIRYRLRNHNRAGSSWVGVDQRKANCVSS